MFSWVHWRAIVILFPIFYRVIFCCKPEYAYGYHCEVIVFGSLSGLKNIEKYKFHPVTLTVFSWGYLITLALEGFFCKEGERRLLIVSPRVLKTSRPGLWQQLQSKIYVITMVYLVMDLIAYCRKLIQFNTIYIRLHIFLSNI